MPIKIRREIFVERERTVRIRLTDAAAQKNCPVCVQASPLVNVTAAARIANFSQRSIFRLIEANAVHFEETANGFLLVCIRSLDDFQQSQKEKIR